MRYYPGVSPAIPHTRAGWSRVTHPFAGYPLRDPRDLHVLSTPPAFVLSQDQTLQEKVQVTRRTRPSDASKDRVRNQNIVTLISRLKRTNAQGSNESHRTTSHTRLSISCQRVTPQSPVFRGKRNLVRQREISRGAVHPHH